MTGRRAGLVTLSVLGLLGVAVVAVVVGVRVAADESRNEGGWLTGWGPLVGVATVTMLCLPVVLGLIGAALSGRAPRTGGALLLVGGLGGLVVGILALLASLTSGLVTLPVAVVCTLAFADLSRGPDSSSVPAT